MGSALGIVTHNLSEDRINYIFCKFNPKHLFLFSEIEIESVNIIEYFDFRYFHYFLR